MLKRVYDFNIGVRYVGTMLALLVISAVGIIFWASSEQEETAIEQARNFSTSVHQMTMAGLTAMMFTGTIKQRGEFLDQIKQSENVKELRVLRAPAVAKQYGEGTADEHPRDDVERQVLASGKEYSEVVVYQGGTALRVVMPALASTNYLGKNCLMCHTLEPEGAVLGAVSMVFSLDQVETAVHDFSVNIAIATSFFCLILLGVIYWGTTHFVTRPLDELTHGLRVIAEGEGDLTRRLKVVGKDEIARTSSVFNQVMEKFRDLIVHVRDSADQVSTASRELLGNAHQVSESSSQQQTMSASAAAAVEEIATQMANVAGNTERVHQLSRDSLTRTDDGNASLHQLAGQLRQVEKAVKEIASSVGAFIRNTDSITEMTNQVRDIAEQTNMLALNAAIEAARAGEQGRGFAVVADEVRNLAEKSAQSANQIDEVTQDLSRQSKQVETAITNGVEQLESSRSTMAEVEAVLGEAKGAVDQVVIGLDEITEATEQQRAASREVASNVELISGMADANSKLARQTAEAVRHLEQLAEGLQDTVGKFRV